MAAPPHDIAAAIVAAPRLHDPQSDRTNAVKSEIAATAAILAFLGLGARADADPAQEAQTLAASGDFVGAAVKFREAYAATGKAELVCNVGVAYYKASDLPRAHRYLQTCQQVGSSLDRSFMQQVAAVVKAVERLLEEGAYAPVEVLVEPSSAAAKVRVVDGVPHDEAFAAGARVWFPHGTYEVIASAPGHVDTRRTLTVKGWHRIVLPMTLGAAAADIGFVATPPTTRRSSKRLVAYISGGTGIILALGGVYFGLRARSLANDVESACALDCDWPLIKDTDASGRRARAAALVFSGLGAAALVTSVGFYLLDRRERAVPLAVVPHAGGALAAWTGSW